MEHYDVAIVGAGVWGLCAAHTFLSVDPTLSLIIVDSKKTLGGVWAIEQLYPGLRTNHLQTYFEFSDFPIVDADVGVKPRGFISGEAVHNYLYKYAERYGLLSRILLGMEVVRAVEGEGNTDGAWRLEIRSANDGRENTTGNESSNIKHLSCAKLIIATGFSSQPSEMTYNGMGNFTKPLFHSVDFAKMSPSLLADSAVKEVTVVGGSKSAHDAVYMFATADKHVTWILHRPGRGRGGMPMATPYMNVPPFFKVWLEGILLYRPLTWFGIAPWSDGDGFSWIRRLLHNTRVGRSLVRSFFSTLGHLIAETSGLMEDGQTKLLVPDSSMLWYGTQSNSLNYDQDFYQLIRDGHVSVVRAEIEKLQDNTIYLDDNQSVQTDAFVSATGWDCKLNLSLEPTSQHLEWGCPVAPSQDNIYPELDARADQELFKRFPMLRLSPAQPERFPGRTPWRLWRFIAPPSQVPNGSRRNLAFLNAINCYQGTIKAELTSLWTYAYLYDRLTVATPKKDEVQNEVSLWCRFGKWRVPFGMQGKYADFLYEAMPYYDLLLRDLGLRSWRKGFGLIGEIFGSRYDSRDYKGIIAEWVESQKNQA